MNVLQCNMFQSVFASELYQRTDDFTKIFNIIQYTYYVKKEQYGGYYTKQN